MDVSSFRHVLPSRVREVLRHRLPKSALQWLSPKATKASTKANPAVKLARTHLRKKDFELAELVINQAIQLHQGDPRLVQELAAIATARKIWPEAIKRWQAAMELWGNSAPPDAYLGLARAYDHQGGANVAEFILRQGIAANPGDRSLSRELARLSKRRPSRRVRDLADYMFSGFAEPSIAELEQIRRNPKSDYQVDRAEASWALARYFASQGCWEQSLEKLLFCSCVAPTNWPLRASALEVLTGECLIQLGFTDEAAARLSDHAYCVRSSGSASYVHLANSYLMIANAKAAKPDWRHSQFETDKPLYWVNLIYKTFGLTTLELVDFGLPLRFSNISGSKARDLSTFCNHQETVSVIVPAHNAEETIRCTISSLLYQSWNNVEIVVVDDASSDSTYGIASEMALVDERIKVVRRPDNRGAYAARNTGLAKATGSVVTTLDSDDYAHPDLIKAAMRVFQEHPNILLATTHWARVTEELRLKLAR